MRFALRFPVSLHLTSRSGIHVRLTLQPRRRIFATVQLRSILLLVVFRHGYVPCRFALRERDAYAVRRPKIERLRRSSYLDLAYGLLRSLRAHRPRAHLQNICIVCVIGHSRESRVVNSQSRHRPRPHTGSMRMVSSFDAYAPMTGLLRGASAWRHPTHLLTPRI